MAFPVDFQQHIVAIDPGQDACPTVTPANPLGHNLGFFANKAFKVLTCAQRTVYPRRGHFQDIGAFIRLGGLDNRIDPTVGRGEVVNGQPTGLVKVDADKLGVANEPQYHIDQLKAVGISRWLQLGYQS
jgi:hypothetical protein